MAVLRTKDIRKMGKEEKEKKLKELKMELIKSSIPGKTGKVKVKEIKKAIARIKTLVLQENKK